LLERFFLDLPSQFLWMFQPNPSAAVERPDWGCRSRPSGVQTR